MYVHAIHIYANLSKSRRNFITEFQARVYMTIPLLFFTTIVAMFYYKFQNGVTPNFTTT